MSAFTLRNKIEESKAMYLERRGKLDWQWTDEGLPYAIMDYHSCVGSVWILRKMTGRPLRKMDFLVMKSLLYAKIVRMNK